MTDRSIGATTTASTARWSPATIAVQRQWREFSLVALLLLLMAVYTVIAPNFLTVFNLTNILRQVSITAIAAVGATAVILVAGIDLSVGSVVALTGTLAAQHLVDIPDQTVMDATVAVLIALAAGTVVGIVNGLVITRLRVPAFIATLATLTIVRGVALLRTDSYPVSIPSGPFMQIGVGRVAGIPVPVIIMAIMFLIGYVILNRMTIGRRIYAIGGNLRAAQLSGINVNRVLLFVYAFAGFCAAVSGVIVASRLSSGQPAGSIGFELDVIAAVVVGGTSLAGGRGRLLNTLLGAILIGVLGNGLILMNVPEYWQRIVTGCVIVIAVTADMLLRRKST